MQRLETQQQEPRQKEPRQQEPRLELSVLIVAFLSKGLGRNPGLREAKAMTETGRLKRRTEENNSRCDGHFGGSMGSLEERTEEKYCQSDVRGRRMGSLTC